MKKQVRSSPGMTILEIMIVITIIGIVASVLAYAIGQARDKMLQSKAEQDLARLSAAIQMLEFDTGQWPGHSPRTATRSMVGYQLPEITNLALPSSGLIAADVTFSNAGWRGPYLDSIPVDPWGRPYFFDPDYVPAGQSEYRAVVGSWGPHLGGSYGINDWESDNIYIEITPKLK